MSSINTNKQIQLKIDNKAKCQRRTFWIPYNHYLLYLIDILCINLDIRGQCIKCAFTISIFAISVLYCRWKNQTHLQLFWNRGARRGCAILPWRNVSRCHMMVKGGLHISKSRTNPWGTTQSLTQTQALGSAAISSRW